MLASLSSGKHYLLNSYDYEQRLVHLDNPDRLDSPALVVYPARIKKISCWL